MTHHQLTINYVQGIIHGFIELKCDAYLREMRTLL
jgi:hypothetical protein